MIKVLIRHSCATADGWMDYRITASNTDYADKDKYKALGFSWDPKDKTWYYSGSIEGDEFIVTERLLGKLKNFSNEKIVVEQKGEKHD